jgi:muconolactone delta-isomerase
MVPLWKVFELSLNVEPAGAHPLDVPVTGAFRHEGGTRFDIDGFYDGDDVYKVRFMPSAIGTWAYRVTVAGQVARKGTFRCSPSDLPGPLRQDERNPYHFVFSNGQPYYMMGNTAYNALVTYRNARASFCQFLDDYAAKGFNWTRFFLQQTTWPTSGGVVWPWGGTPTSPDFSTFNLQTFREAEGVINEMAARNVVASVILLHPCDAPLAQADSVERMRACHKYVHYAVARLSAYWNVVWNLANEWHRGGVFTYDEMDELGHTLHAIDPYQRLTACHHYARFEFYDRAWTDMSSIQHRGLPHEINQVILQNKAFAKIVINDEYGYEGDNHSPPNDPDNVRHDHWAIAMAGGYGTYGDKTKGPKIAAYFSALPQDAIGSAVPETLQHLAAFMTQTGYRSMAPANALLSDCDPHEAFCLANIGQEYIVYLVKGQPFALNLTHVHGTLSARWYNPRNGTYTPVAPLYVAQSSGELPPDERNERSWIHIARQHKVTFSPPDERNDWVLYLKK